MGIDCHVHSSLAKLKFIKFLRLYDCIPITDCFYNVRSEHRICNTSRDISNSMVRVHVVYTMTCKILIYSSCPLQRQFYCNEKRRLTSNAVYILRARCACSSSSMGLENSYNISLHYETYGYSLYVKCILARASLFLLSRSTRLVLQLVV